MNFKVRAIENQSAKGNRIENGSGSKAIDEWKMTPSRDVSIQCFTIKGVGATLSSGATLEPLATFSIKLMKGDLGGDSSLSFEDVGGPWPKMEIHGGTINPPSYIQFSQGPMAVSKTPQS